MTHDRCCPLDDPALECVVCDAIGRARNEEKDAFTRVWKDNIGPLTRRYYMDGYRDATNGRRPADWVS